MVKLDVKAFGLSVGMIWGLAMFTLGLINTGDHWGSGIVEVMSTLYIGYKPTVLGSIIGGIWGFLDAGIGGVVVAWLYNKIAK